MKTIIVPAWEQDFRDDIFGDLKIIKTILDADPESYYNVSGEVGLSVWNKCLKKFFLSVVHEMTAKEQKKFLEQLTALGDRWIAAIALIEETKTKIGNGNQEAIEGVARIKAEYAAKEAVSRHFQNNVIE